MNVGFYYHVEAVFDGDGVARVPALFGRFVEQLAKQVGSVTLYAHGGSRTGIEDYRLSEPLVRCIDLGPRRRFPERLFAPRRSLRAFKPSEHGIDVMLIRGPTPLIAHLVEASDGIPVALHIVGEYAVSNRDRRTRSMPWWRDELIKALFRLYTRQERRAAASALVLVNSPHLVRSYAAHSDPDVVFESTLTDDSIVDTPRAATPGLGRDRTARLLFAGRLIPEKGLWEAVEGVRILTDRGFDVTLAIAGWEAPSDPVVGALRDRIATLGVIDRVRFIGYVPAGPELADVYRSVDVFVLPSHGDGEGFPRTIFEAMGAGTPVVTTAVGGVPDWLADGQQVVIVDRRSAVSLAEGIERLLSDEGLRERVAGEGLAFARRHTLEKGCELLARRLVEWSREGRRTASSKA